MGAFESPSLGVWGSAVRPTDCDWFGHVNNAVYTDYVISATIAVWGRAFGAARWRMRKIVMDFKTPASQGDTIEVSCWPSGRSNGHILCGYRMTIGGDQTVVAEASTTWEAPQEPSIAQWPTDSAAGSQRLRSTPQKPNRPGAYTYRRTRVVQPYEADQTGTINPTWIFRWGWAGMFAAATEAGWPLERWRNAGFLTYQFHRDAELRSILRPGDEVEVQSRLYDVQRVRATWEHRILRDNEIVAIDRADGAFLNSDGRISAAPEGMMESLVAGPRIS